MRRSLSIRSSCLLNIDRGYGSCFRRDDESFTRLRQPLEVGIPRGSDGMACLSMVKIAICGLPNRAGSSSVPTFRITAGRPGRRVIRCVPHSAQNSRVTGAFEIAARELLRRSLGVAEAVDRHQHEHVGRAAGDILAFAAVALRLHHRLALGDIAHLAAIASAFQFHGILPVLSLLSPTQCIAFAEAAWACLSIASMICGHIGIGNAWPMPSIISSLAPGIEAAVSLPPAGCTSGSTVP